MQRDYELGFILNPEVSEEETHTILNRVEQIAANHGGQIVKVNQWGRRRLAYPIERHRDGNYIFIDMILTPETVAELEQMLKISEVVLRHMMKRRDPKAVQKEREERAEREARAEAAAAAAAAAAAPEATEEEPATTSEQPAEEEPAPAPEQPAEEPEVSTEEAPEVPPATEESHTIEA